MEMSGAAGWMRRFRTLAGLSLLLPALSASADARAYAEYLKTLDPGREESIAFAIGHYLLDVAPQPIAERDAAYAAFHGFFEESQQRLGTVVAERLGFREVDLVYKYPEESMLLNRVGLRFASAGEGAWTLLPIPGAIEHIFAPHVSETVKAFMKIHEPETEGVYAGDGGVAIPLRGLADRVGLWESYINEFPDSPLKEAAKEALAGYFGWFFFGVSNTSVFGNTEDYVDAYRFYLSKYPRTKTAGYVQKYLDLLQKTNGEKTPEVEAYETELHGYVSSVGRDWVLEFEKEIEKIREDRSEAASRQHTETLPPPETTNKPEADGPSKKGRDGWAELRRFLDSLDKTEASSVLAAVGKVWIVTAEMDAENNRDAMVRVFLDFYSECLSGVEARLRRDLDGANPNADVTDPLNNGNLLIELERCGFQVVPCGEGAWVLSPKKDFLSDHLAGLVSADYRSFIKNRDLEMDSVYLHGDALGISPQELADRIGRWEAFRTENQDWECDEAAWMLRSVYLPLFMFGTEKSPTYGPGTGLLPQYEEAYAYFLRVYPRSGVAALLKGYATDISGDDSDKTDTVADYRKKLAAYLDPFEEFPVVPIHFIAEFLPERPKTSTHSASPPCIATPAAGSSLPTSASYRSD